MNKSLVFASLFVLIILGALPGCATLDKNECENANWELIGLGDGRRGAGLNRLDLHRRACAEHGIIPDEAAYMKGRDRGLQTYCTANKGYETGIRGEKYRGVCPKHSEVAFLDAYRFGSKLYEIKSDIQRMEAQLSQAQEHYRRLETDAEHDQFVIVNKRNTPAVREHLVQQLRYIERELATTKQTIRQLKLDIDQKYAEFKKMKSFNPYR